MSDHKYIPSGVWLKCDKGSTTQQLSVLPRTIKLYDENWAIETDAVPLINIPSFGTCAINGTCLPTTMKWDNPVEGNMTVSGAKPIKEDSICLCPIGGEIKIFFDRQSAADSISADEADRKAAEAKEDSNFWMYVGIGALVVVGVAAVVLTGGAAAPILVAAGQAALTGAAIGAGVGGVATGAIAYSSGERGTDLVKSIGMGVVTGAAAGAVIAGTAGGASVALGGAVSAGSLATGALAPSALYLGKATFHEGQAMYYEPTLERGVVFIADLILSVLAVKAAKDVISNKGLPKSEFCKKDPVDVITGLVFYPYTDFELPGPIPLKWEREYNSGSKYSGLLGHGVSSCYDLTLIEHARDNIIEVLQKDGTSLFVTTPTEDEASYHSVAQIEVFKNGNSYKVFDYRNRLYYTYEKFDAEKHKPTLLEDEKGFSVRLIYNSKKLVKIIDSSGRNLTVETNDKGYISKILHKTLTEERMLVGYEYNEVGDMISISDALNQKTLIEYDNHKMTKKTDRNGQSFYWKYNLEGKCIYTYGDGGLQEGFFEYLDHHTIHTDPTGLREDFYFNDFHKPQKITDAFENSKTFEYDEKGRILNEIDEEGLQTQYLYDENGNLTKTIFPDGSAQSYVYDEENRLLLSMDAMGNAQQWIYKENKLVGVRNKEKNLTTFYYDENNLIEKISNDLGDETALKYDNQYNLIALARHNGRNTSWKYNAHGDCIAVINPLGKMQQFEYDRLGRLKNVKLPSAEVVNLKYDAYDNILKVNSFHKKIEYDYTPLGSVKSRSENGIKVTYAYDKQERLTSLSNEKGDQYRFQRNERGDIIKEVSFDGITKYYNRDKAGKVVKIKREGNRFTEYEYNKRGQIIRADYHDGYWESFLYNALGLLIEAKNADTDVYFTRNKLGLVTQEKQGQHTLNYEYDDQANLISIKSSLGADITYKRDKNGHISDIKAGGENAWITNIKRNMLGLEIERSLPGGIVSSWSYDSQNNPIKQSVSNGKEKTLDRNYNWNANDKLQQIGDMLSKRGTEFGYDELESLAWAKYEDGSYDYKLPDEIGNLYKTKGKKDRVYGKGGKLLKDENWYYLYDPEGNLRLKSKTNVSQPRVNNNALVEEESKIQKVFDPKTGYYVLPLVEEELEDHSEIVEWHLGDWFYTWWANGMLRSIKKPDGSEVSFEYDALGRRTAKIVHSLQGTKQSQIYRFVWDGNVLLHEWHYENTLRPKLTLNDNGQFSYSCVESVENLVTWVYEEGSFVPSAKIIGEEKFSIISDYIGRPIQVYHETGRTVWETDYDIYGRVRNLQGEKSFIPFRQLGQYEDEELDGLYYNRFRYYDCNIGAYISQDPIGLEGNNPNFYGYTHDSNTRVDIFGLNECSVDLVEFQGTEKPWTKGATPNSKYSHIDPKTGRVNQNAIYDKNGDVIGHVDFKNHGIESGHWHEFPPGQPGAGHGKGAGHYPNTTVPKGWDQLPNGLEPRIPIGE